MNCLELEEEINNMDDFLAKERSYLLDNLNKLYLQKRTIVEPQTTDKENDNDDDNKEIFEEIKFKYLKLKL